MFSLFIAWLAALLTSFLVIPMAVNAFQEDASPIAIRTVLIMCFASFFWTIHGFMAGDPALIFAGPVVLCSTGAILYRHYSGTAASGRPGRSSSGRSSMPFRSSMPRRTSRGRRG